MILIQVENLSFSYKNKKIFENLSFTIKKPSLNFIVGCNGSGKTTLLKILFLNEDKYFKTKDVQFIWEFQNLYDELTLLQNLKIYFNLNTKKKLNFEEELKKILSYWDLDQYLKSPIKNLSYGYRQKSLIARSIITKPDILIIDEPFLGLDYSSYLSFLKIISDYSSEITFLISTQNPKVKDEIIETTSLKNNTLKSQSIQLNSMILLFTIIKQ